MINLINEAKDQPRKDCVNAVAIIGFSLSVLIVIVILSILYSTTK